MSAIAKLTVVFAAVMLPLTADRLNWRWVTPRIESQVRTLQRVEAQTLLSIFCKDRIEAIDGIGLTCTTRRLGANFSDIVDDQFHPVGVIFGHFTGSDTDDAAVSGWSAETHPDLWGGTLLLTRRDGKWTPVWYKSAVLTHSCRTVTMPSLRDVLLCEAEDGGMGRQFHYLFSVDLTRPADIRKTLLATADSYHSQCTIRQQEIQLVDWTSTRRLLSITLRTPQWQRVSSETCAGDPPAKKRPPLRSTLEFDLTDRGFAPIALRR
jgi:hypothetical protein